MQQQEAEMQSIFTKGAEYLRLLRTKFWEIPFVRQAEAQRVFDRVATHLFTQGTRAFEGGACRYRTEAGLMCAVGCFVPANVYDPDMEGGIRNDLLKYVDERKIREVPAARMWRHLRLLEKLQTNHDDRDNWSSTARMQEVLASTAKKFGLSMNYVGSLSFSDR
jgi:hypothetical protein